MDVCKQYLETHYGNNKTARYFHLFPNRVFIFLPLSVANKDNSPVTMPIIKLAYQILLCNKEA